MPLELRWKASLSATCLHVAFCRRAGLPAADNQCEQALGALADELVREIELAGWPAEHLIEQLAGLSAEYENNRELVTRAAARLHLPPLDPASQVRVAGAIADLEAALLRTQPEIVDELAVRGVPLRDQWEARGPGLMREVTRLTEEGVVPEAAEVVLVAPYVGGHGLAHAAQNRVTFEAMLVDPNGDLPETVRLAWLACQLNSDLPRYAEALPRSDSARAFQLAVLLPVLAAAEAVELARCDAALVDQALDAWRLRRDLPADASARVWRWWNACLDSPRSWGVAVAELDRLLWP
jgi:hypothetical protein